MKIGFGRVGILDETQGLGALSGLSCQILYPLPFKVSAQDPFRGELC
jgi:hypothetical protein